MEERLTFRFVEQGLSSLRRAFGRVEDGLEGIQDETEEAQDQMGNLRREARDAAVSIGNSVGAMQEALDEIDTDEARRQLQRLDEEFDDVGAEGLASRATSASVAIQSEMEDAGDAVEDLGTEALQTGTDLEAAGSLGEESFEDFTQQVLAARAALQTLRGGGVTAELDADIDAATGGGQAQAESSTLGGTAALFATKEILDQIRTAGIGESISESVSKSVSGSLEGLPVRSGRQWWMDMEAGETVPEFENVDMNVRDADVTLPGGGTEGDYEGMDLRSPEDVEQRGGIPDYDRGETISEIPQDKLPESFQDDDDGGGGRRRRRGLRGLFDALPHELTAVTGALRSFFSSISTSTAALVGGGVGGFTLTAAISAASSALAGFATFLGAKFGDQRIKTDLKAVRAQFKETARQAFEAFEPIIRGQVIPTLTAFNEWLSSSIEALRRFTRRNLDEAKSLGRMFASLGSAIGEFFELFQKLGVIGLVTNLFQALADILSVAATAVDEFLSAINNFISWASRKLGLTTESGSGDGQEVSTSDDSPDRGALFGDKLSKILTTMQAAIGRAKQAQALGASSKKDSLKARLQARQKAFEKLQKLAQKFPSLFNDRLLKSIAKRIETLRSKIDGLGSSSNQQPGVETKEMDAAAPESYNTSMRPGLTDGGPGLKDFRKAAGAAKGDIGAINGLIKGIKSNFNTLVNDEAQALVVKLQRMKSEAKSAGQQIKSSIQNSLARAGNRAFRAFGQSVSQALFGGGGGMSTNRRRLQLFNAKKQMRSLRESLRQGRISHKAFSLRVKAQQKQIQKAQDKLNESMEGGFVSAMESMGDAAKRIFKQLIAEVTATIAKMAILKAITSALSMGGGGFFGSVITQMGGGSFLNSSSSAAPQPQPVQVQGTFRMAGEEMVAQVEHSRQNQRRRGRR